MLRNEANCGKRDHITVCICTYKRPRLLLRLLEAICKQRTDGLVEYSIVVVDNDCAESAKAIVRILQERCPISTGYYCEPEQNISLASNKAIERLRGDFVAFIDDDVVHKYGWLLKLYSASMDFHAD